MDLARSSVQYAMGLQNVVGLSGRWSSKLLLPLKGLKTTLFFQHTVGVLRDDSSVGGIEADDEKCRCRTQTLMNKKKKGNSKPTTAFFFQVCGKEGIGGRGWLTPGLTVF